MRIGEWPALAVGYTLTGDGTTDPAIVLELSMKLERYAVSPVLAADIAIRNALTDRAAYEHALYQLAQPDIGFALSTTLEPATAGKPVSHPLDVGPFRAFVLSAWTVLDAIANPRSDGCAPYVAQPSDTNLGTIAAKFAGNDPGLLGTINLDVPGLFRVGTDVYDAASGTSVPTGAQSTFASLVDAFANAGHTVTAESLARDNATTADLVQPGALWLTPPLIAFAQGDGAADTIARIAERYGVSIESVARMNAGVLGFLAADVELPPYDGITHTTGENDTLNALIGAYTPPGGTAPPIADLAEAFADVAMIAPGTLILAAPVSTGTTVQVAPAFAAPIVPLGVTVTQTSSGNVRAPDAARTAVEPHPHVAGVNWSALDAFAASVETALPGMHVATGERTGEDDDALGRRLWLVNFGSARGPAIAFAFERARAVRSFATPPLSTSLASGTVTVTPYVSGTGLSGTTHTFTFADADLDAWASPFFDAIDFVLAPAYSEWAQETSRTHFDRIVGAKRALATAIAARMQYVLAGGRPGELGSADPRRDTAITAMEQSLLAALANAYAIESVVQAAIAVSVPDTDGSGLPRLSGEPALTQPSTDVPASNVSFAPGEVPLTQAVRGAPALASFLLTVQAPERERSATVTIEYDVVAVEQSSAWLTLVHRPDAASLDGVTVPIPLRRYPQPPALDAPDATASFAAPAGTYELVRWDARASWLHQAADQDEVALQVELGTVNLGAQLGTRETSSTGALAAALAQFSAVWPAMSADLAMPASGAPGAPPDRTVAGGLAALATIATDIAAAWPRNAAIAAPLETWQRATAPEIVPGSYGYTLAWPRDDDPNLSTVTVDGDAANPSPLWPELAVDAGDGAGLRALALQSSTRAQAVYAYPSGIEKGTMLRYQATFPKLDVMMVADFALSVSIARNAHLVDGARTSPSFVYRTPYTRFPSPAIPLLLIDADFDAGSGSVHHLHAALQAFFRGLLDRPSAPAGSQRMLRVAMSYGYEPSPGAGSDAGADDGTSGPMAMLPVTLVPSVLLTINGDNGTSIDAFARALADLVVAWNAQTKPSEATASLFFDVTLFAYNANAAPNASDAEKPLLVARSVRYALR